MPDLPDRFRVLDQLEVPDIDARARALGPRPPTEPDGPSAGRRAAIVVVALIVAMVGVGFAVQAFRNGAEPAAPTSTSGPADRELIVFTTRQDVGPTNSPARGTAIAVTRADGTGFRYITAPETTSNDEAEDPWIERYGFSSDAWPVWSPDGSTIAFVRSYAEGVDSLCTISLDGSDFRVVVRDLHGAELAWSPDGSTFAFYSEQDGGVHLIDVDGTNERALDPRTGGPNQDTPSWSPDGRWVYYAAGDLFAVRADGSDAHRVVDLPWSASTAYLSPDGSTFVVGRPSAQPDGHSSVWLVRRDGSNLACIVKASDEDWLAAGWSGARVLVVKETQKGVPELWMAPAYAQGDRVRVDLPDGAAPYGSASGWSEPA